MANRNIVDLGSMIIFGAKNFVNEDFPPFGNGRSFAKKILGKSTKVNLPNLIKIVTKLKLPDLHEGRRVVFINILNSNGAKDRASLLALKVSQFNKSKLDFGDFENARKFYKGLFGKSVDQYFIEDDLHKMADLLGFPEIEKSDFLKALSRGSITDAFNLFQMGPTDFMEKEFPPFGQGCKFFGMVFGRTFHRVGITDFKDLIEYLGLPDYSVKTQKSLCQSLFRHKIYDCRTMNLFHAQDFSELEFPPYGKGQAFLSAALGIPDAEPTRQLMSELVYRLRLPQDANDQEPKIKYYPIKICLDELNGHDHEAVIGIVLKTFDGCNIHVRSQLLKKGAEWFEGKKFPDLGYGINFASFLLRRSVYKVTKPM